MPPAEARRRARRFAGCSALAAAVLLAPSVRAEELRVESGGASLAAALAAATDGDTVRVVGGVHPGPLEIDAGIHLVGEQWPVLDGGGRGTVVAVRAAGASIAGFVVRGSGPLLDEENSGIAVEAPRVVVEGNRLEDVLFGVYLRRAEGSTVRGNRISGKPLALPRRGDAIRVWYSDRTTVSGNVITNARDVVLWYSKGLSVIDNQVRGGRYGLHFMYCDDAEIRGNLLEGNSVGAFLMYSRRLRLLTNTIAGNHGPSGYGVGLKDMDDALVLGNLFAGNRVGAFLDNSPREWRSETTVERNIFAGNDTGVVLLPNVRRASFVDNGFEENEEQVTISGGGADPQANRWLNNYWSDYGGFDSDGDGIGEIPYRADRLFERLADRHSQLRVFLHSPATDALDFAARAFPVVRPEPKLSDPAPRMGAVRLGGLPLRRSGPRTPWGSAAAILLAGVAFMGLLPRLVRRSSPPQEGPPGGALAVISARGLGMRFGDFWALRDLAFEIGPGEAVALWGPNGAGKTTALRALLGIVPFEGSVRVAGLDPRKAGRRVRRVIGFVPQESGLQGDLRAAEVLEFFADLRRVEGARALELARRLGLEAHLEKRVRELSGGLRQRLALAVALLDDPPILMLDEPAANLDPEARASFYELLLALKADGKTLVFTSHRLEEVSLLADRVLGLDGGRLVSDAPPERMPAAARAEITLRFPPEALEVATARLEAAGLAPRRVGSSLLLSVAAEHKVEALARALSAGLEPRDVSVVQYAQKGGWSGPA